MQREQLGAAHAGGSSSASDASAPDAFGLLPAEDQLVAFGAPGDRTGRELRRDVTAVARALPDAAPGAQVLIVIRADRYALLVALLAVWRRGFVAALPPEHDREAITALATESVTVLHDTASGAALRVGALLAAAETEQPAADDDAGWHGFAGSGRLYQRAADGLLHSASSDEAWLQRAQLLAERLELRAGQRCATSVGLGHPHGVLLGTLAPLLAGAAFLRSPLAGAELGRTLASTPVDLLISVPAQLTGLLDGGALPVGRPERVVIALEPLSAELRDRASQGLGARFEDRSELVREIPLLCAGEPSEARCPADEALLVRMRAVPGVRDAAVIALQEQPDRPSRCVAVVGPGPAESAQPLDLARLRALVAQHDARAELLEVREIRRDALGRYQRAALLRLFRRGADGGPLHSDLRWSEVSSSQADAVREHRASAQIPADYPYFEGHFPGYPILPGAAQLSELVLPLVRRVRPELGPLCAMTRLKFSGRIQPGETIDVVLQGRPEDRALDFTLRRGKTLCAAGSLSFAPGGAASP